MCQKYEFNLFNLNFWTYISESEIYNRKKNLIQPTQPAFSDKGNKCVKNMNSTYSTLVFEHIYLKMKPMKKNLIQPIQPAFWDIVRIKNKYVKNMNSTHSTFILRHIHRKMRSMKKIFSNSTHSTIILRYTW